MKKVIWEVFGDEIVELGKENKNIYVIDIDIGKLCKIGKFIKQFFNQYVNVGIVEQNGVGLVVGLVIIGKILFVSIYVVFGLLCMVE